MAYFPMFVDLNRKPCLVVGGGAVALRKVQVLRDFGAAVTVTAPEICPEILAMRGGGTRDDSPAVTEQPCAGVDVPAEKAGGAAEPPGVEIRERCFAAEDLEGFELVVAATDDPELTGLIAAECRKRRIPVNTVDRAEDCSFIFPSYVKEKNVVAAFSSGGSSPVLTQYLKQREKEILTPLTGDMGEKLGSVRREVKERIRDTKDRKEVFRRILAAGLENGAVPADEEIEEIIGEYEVHRGDKGI